APDFKGIGARTRGEIDCCDVQQHGCIIAAKIRDRYGHTIDFSNKADQELVLRWLNCEFGRFANKTVRYATRLDTDQERDGQALLFERLFARHFDEDPLLGDPLIQLVNDAEKQEKLEAIQQSFSEAAVYQSLLIQFNQNLKDLARYLNMRLSKLSERIQRLESFSKIQPSLFDGTEFISLDFEPQLLPSRTRRR